MPRNFVLTIPWGDKASITPTEWLDGLDMDKIIYICAQLEKGEKTDYVHVQGYIEVNRSMRYSELGKLLGVAAHIEPRRGTRLQCKQYCTKQETRIDGPWERGTWHETGQGRRTDLIEGCDCVRVGGLLGLIDEHPELYVKYHRGFEKLHLRLTEPDRCFRKVTVRVYWGTGGSGKTRRCWEEASYERLFPFPLQTKDSLWCDGYEGQDSILLDDFDGSVMKFKTFLRFVDGYPLQIPIKGGFVWANWTTVYITANSHPRQWWHVGFPKELERRLSIIEEMSGHFEVSQICTEVVGNTSSTTSTASLLSYTSSEESE